MDKQVILAAAGSGKTTRIVNDLDGKRRALIVTYTEENFKNLRRKVMEKFGHMPPNVSVMTYFTFLHSFCLQPLVGLKYKSKGINFDYESVPPPGRFGQSQDQYYIDSIGRFYVGRLAKFIAARYMDGVVERLERFFDVLCVDEFQDFAGHDFDFMLELVKIRTPMLLVGDFWQHTYDTSRDGGKNQSLYDDYGKYLKVLRGARFSVDTESLARSRRCSSAVCVFISEALGIEIKSDSARSAEVVNVDSKDEALAILSRPDVVKLFYQEHYKYGCYSQNWGKSKGEDHYDEVCVVLNGTALKHFKRGQLRDLPASSRNKLYVALSRSRGNVYIVPHTLIERR